MIPVIPGACFRETQNIRLLKDFDAAGAFGLH
jgi:hypothetical protein